MKKKLTLAICIVVMLVPAVLAVFLYKPKQPDIVKDPESVTAVTVTDSFSNSVEADKEDIGLFTDLIKGTSVQSIPQQVYEFRKFIISFTRGDTVTSYSFYMSAEKPDQVYFRDSEDKCYKADSRRASTFMATKYALSLYDTALPVLTAGNAGTVIPPAECKWKYRAVNGDFIPVENINTSTEVKVIDDIPKTLGLRFSNEPTTTTLVISCEGKPDKTTLYNSEFTGIFTDEAKYYDIKVTARWDQDETKNSCGEATYTFRAYIRPSMTVSASATVITKGEIIKITANNASSSGIKFETVPDVGSTPVFYDNGDSSVAYFATSYETEPGEYKVVITYDDVRDESIKITVKEPAKGYSPKSYAKKDYSEAKVTETFSSANIAALDTIKQSVFSGVSSSTLLCAGEKPTLPTKASDHKTGYGVVATFEATGDVRRHEGIDYDQKKGSDVKAILSGTVVYVGSNPIHGGMIVIDHGCGVRSWYCRVNNGGVSVGQSVSRGDIIAKSDDSGFGDSSRVHLGLSVGNVFVSPTLFFDNNGLPN
ncbi:MAG: M23 family metallopeptidase [Clostridia bacterium]|nr:M23 family metallopeptidase [Clostridia bacterium]